MNRPTCTLVRASSDCLWERFVIVRCRNVLKLDALLELLLLGVILAKFVPLWLMLAFHDLRRWFESLLHVKNFGCISVFEIGITGICEEGFSIHHLGSINQLLLLLRWLGKLQHFYLLNLFKFTERKILAIELFSIITNRKMHFWFFMIFGTWSFRLVTNFIIFNLFIRIFDFPVWISIVHTFSDL